ncbi:MAG: hypothetical protein IPO36_21530 [Anaerolineales bacterium]|nr:hypothetical protein [Anaerolineales bacterium]
MIAGSLILIGAGVIHLGVTSDVLRVTLGLLTMLTGFEILYAAVESSILVAGLLALTNLGLGIVGSYLMIAGSIPLETEEDAERAGHLDSRSISRWVLILFLLQERVSSFVGGVYPCFWR